MKKRNTTKILLILIIMMMLLQGCTTNNRPVTFNKYQGNSGIDLKFIANGPPSTVYEGTEIKILLEIWNRGAYDILQNETNKDKSEHARINVRFDPIYFTETPQNNDFKSMFPGGTSLLGKSEMWPQGERIIIPFTTLIVNKIPGTRETPTTNIEATVCYPYRTYISQTICIDKDIYGVEERPICRSIPRYTYSNQGAPIAISKIEVDLIPTGYSESQVQTREVIFDEQGFMEDLGEVTRKERIMFIEPVFRIYARNVGKGDAFILKEEANKDLACNFTKSFEVREHNKVKLVNATLDGHKLDCGENASINLANPNHFITCRLKPDTGDELQTYARQNEEQQFIAELEYYYTESITKQITIQRTR